MGNGKRLNQLLIVSDEERRNDWLRSKLELREHFNRPLEIERTKLGYQAGHQGPS